MTAKEARRKKQPWRENLEAVSMAIAVALLFKTFVLEVSKIPSGSMQPTLMGSPAAGVHDRVLVDKLSFAFRDPRRFEIVVFKHPLERSRVMVKRLVGMPNEELRIANGDLWVRPDASAPWAILRRPDDVMDAHWKSLDVDEPERSSWVAVAGEGWRTAGRAIDARGEGRARFRPSERSIVDFYADGYPDSVRSIVTREARGRGVRDGANEVGDLRLSGEVEALEGTESVVIELSEGPMTYELVLPGPAAPADAVARIRVRDSGAYGTSAAPERRADRTVAGTPLRLAAGRATRFAAENLDDRVRLEVDGEVVAETDVAPATDQRSSAAIAVYGSGARLADLDLMRDLFYVPQDLPRATVSIPDDHYVFLGDNTLDSADSRDWKATRFEIAGGDGEARRVRGNFRARGENPRFGRDANGIEQIGFRDEWGEVHWFPRDEGVRDLEVSAPLVPRSLIQGRALAVFWPIQPHRGVIRLGWLH